jgi:hypothetical protein
MDGSTATLIVGSVGLTATVVTAVATSWLDLQRHRETLRHERALGDRAELREVLDDATRVAREAKWATDETLGALRSGDLERTRRAVDAALELARAAAITRARIELRLGAAHPVVTSYESVLDVFADLHVKLQAKLPTGWRVWLAFTHRRTLADELQSIADDDEEPFERARGTFIALSHDLVASRA